MHLACPHCLNPIELVTLPASGEVLCGLCGSTFRVESEATVSLASSIRGRRLGRFELIAAVGSGAFGTVYKARDVQLDRTVAVKVPRAGNLPDGQELDRFLREARSSAQLRHPAIVPVYEVGQEDGLPFLVSDFVEGVTLADRLTAGRPSFRESAALIATAAEALDHAHEHGIIHRDVKPSNIMLRPDDTPALMDFGLAKRAAGEITMTIEGQVLGTPAYMSPEQAGGQAHMVDGRSDIYSLGVVLYRLLTGELPFRGNQRMLLHQVLHDDPKPPRKLNDRIPRDLETICLKAIEKVPDKRYATAKALAEDLRRWLACEPIHARHVSRIGKAWRWCQRRPLLAATGAIAALMLVAVSIVSVLLAVSARHVARVQSSARAAAEEAGRREAALRVEAETARKAADAQRQVAETNEDAAAKNARRAEDQRILAQLQERRAKEGERLGRLNTYAARINLAHQAWIFGDVQRVRDLLDSLRPTPDQEDLRGFEWYLLAGLSQRHSILLDRHQGPVYRVAFSPDGKTLATAGADKTVRLWDPGTGREIAVLAGHRGAVCSLSFAPDGLTLASGGADRTVILWDLLAREPRRTLDGFPESVNCLSYSPDGRILATATSALAEGKGTPITRFRPASKFGELKLWDIIGRDSPVTLRNEKTGILAMAFSPDGKRLAAAVDDAVELWDPARGSGQTPTVLKGNSDFVMCIAFSGDGASLAAGTWDRRVISWDIASRRALGSWTGHRGPISSLTILPNGRQWITGSTDRTVKLWDAASGKERGTIRGHTKPVWSVTLSPDGATLATASWDGTVKLWSPERFQDCETIEADSYALAFSPDSRILACSGNKVTLWDVPELRPRGELPNYEDNNILVAFAPDGETLATAGMDTRVRLWRSGGWECEAILPGHRAKVWALAYAPDGQTLASGSGGFNQPGEIRFWNAVRKEAKAVWMADTLGAKQLFSVRAIAFSPDGRTLAASGSYREQPTRDAVELRDVSTGRALGSLKGEKSHPGWIAYSPDGKLLATGRFDHTIRLWDAATGEPRLVLKGHQDAVYHGAFSPDGRTLATASWDGTAKLWHVATGQELLTLPGSGGVVYSVAFAPDGRTFAMGNPRGGGVFVWRAADKE